jgi:hypothetical protein
MPRSGASDVALSRKGRGGHGMKRRYQIRDQDFGLAIYEADFAAEALAAFLADKLRAALDPADYKVNDFGDGTASVLWRGIEYRAYTAVPAT